MAYWDINRPQKIRDEIAKLEARLAALYKELDDYKYVSKSELKRWDESRRAMHEFCHGKPELDGEGDK